MATIKSYTDLEQSKKLAEILPLESADMVYFGIHQGIDGKYHLSGTNTEDDVVPIYKNFCIKVFAKITASDVINQLPCWSLAALLNVFEDKGFFYKLYFDGVSNVLKVINIDNPNIHEMNYNDYAIDVCYEMILKLHEQKLL